MQKLILNNFWFLDWNQVTSVWGPRLDIRSCIGMVIYSILIYGHATWMTLDTNMFVFFLFSAVVIDLRWWVVRFCMPAEKFIACHRSAAVEKTVNTVNIQSSLQVQIISVPALVTACLLLWERHVPQVDPEPKTLRGPKSSIRRVSALTKAFSRINLTSVLHLLQTKHGKGEYNFLKLSWLEVAFPCLFLQNIWTYSDIMKHPTVCWSAAESKG